MKTGIGHGAPPAPARYTAFVACGSMNSKRVTPWVLRKALLRSTIPMFMENINVLSSGFVSGNGFEGEGASGVLFGTSLTVFAINTKGIETGAVYTITGAPGSGISVKATCIAQLPAMAVFTVVTKAD
ncbi:MAG: hypothetical protein ICV75_08860 [Nitrospiraceae bacterium]|nr:hypothetical protein [Nitrospiraceae bacterium]